MIEHGSYTTLLEKKLLSITLVAMFNGLATQAVCQQIKAKVESLHGQRVGILLDCLKYEGCTREAHIISNQHLLWLNLWLNQQNCTARAII